MEKCSCPSKLCICIAVVMGNSPVVCERLTRRAMRSPSLSGASKYRVSTDRRFSGLIPSIRIPYTRSTRDQHRPNLAPEPLCSTPGFMFSVAYYLRLVQVTCSITVIYQALATSRHHRRVLKQTVTTYNDDLKIKCVFDCALKYRKIASVPAIIPGY